MEEEIQTNEHTDWHVPWSKRDVWFGAGSLILYVIVILAAGLAVNLLQLKMDIGVFIILSELLLMLPVWFFTIHKYKITWREVGFREFSPKYILLGFGLMFIYLIFNAIFSMLVLIPLGKTIQGDLFAQLAKIDWSVWLWLGGAFAAPLAEEVFFRGFIFGGLKNPLGWKWAAVISGLLFALMHMNLTTLLPAFVIGFLFAFLYHKSNSIWPGIIIHTTNNLMAFFAVSLLIKLGEI
ncbi:MAG: CPBP family intramembrane metalloprotease [Anaerolineaceae bacterium]|nr:CPBP family intramembrane metalloprotease [Anaerolineaceae bacterium]